jgi:hypothetical protein
MIEVRLQPTTTTQVGKTYIWKLSYLDQARHLDFWPKKWVIGWMLSKGWLTQRGTHRKIRSQPSILYGYHHAL